MKRTIILSVGFTTLFVMAYTIALAWGWTGHQIVNRKAPLHLPASMQSFKQDSLFFETHSGDADVRINNADTSFYAEGPRHHFDIDDYGSNIHAVPHTLDSMIQKYGWDRVKEDGTNPWATLWTLDSLTAQLARGDMNLAKLTASDLGHYVADGHEPLRCTYNSDGHATGNSGIYYNYDFEMLRRYSTSLSVVPDSVRYISSPLNFIFDYIYLSYARVDSVLLSDNYARSVSGWDGSGQAPASYYDALWEKSRGFTQAQIQRATVDLACLWYTAWVNAGLVNSEEENILPQNFILSQNFPNPFNPETIIRYQLPMSSYVTLKIYNTLGEEVAVLVSGVAQPGLNEKKWDASGIPSGIYLYRVQAGSFSQTKKMLLLR